MKIPLAMGIFAIACGGWAWRFGGAGWLLLWPAMSFAIIAVAYLVGSPWVLGKRADGTRWWPAWVVMWPYLLMTYLQWRAQDLRGQSRPVQVEPGLWLSRRPLPRHLPAVELLIDMTAEFSRVRLPNGIDYFCEPTLDFRGVSAAALTEVVRVAGRRTVLVHCAAGRGRSALAAAAILLNRHEGLLPADAIAQLKRAKPDVGLNAFQLRSLEQSHTHRFATGR